MSRHEKGLKHMTFGAAGMATAICILPLILGASWFGLVGAILAPLEAAAIAVGGAGLLGLAWIKLRGRAPDPGGHGEAAAGPAASAPPACDFDAIPPEDREQHAENAEALLLGAEEVRETAGGYAFRLSPDPEILPRAARFIAHERLCCPFFRFSLTVEPGEEPAWVELSGGPQVKEYLRTDLVARVEDGRWQPRSGDAG